MYNDERPIDSIDLLFMPGRVHDVINSLELGHSWERLPTTKINSSGGERLRAKGISLIPHQPRTTIVGELDDTDIGSPMIIDGQTHMIVDIDKKEREEQGQVREVISEIFPVAVVIVTLALTFAVLPTILRNISDNFLSLSIIGLCLLAIFKVSMWAYRQSSFGSDTTVTLEAVPVWIHYSQDLETVSTNLPSRRTDFIESVQAACIYGNVTMLHEAHNIVNQAQETWRKGFKHPEDS